MMKPGHVTRDNAGPPQPLICSQHGNFAFSRVEPVIKVLLVCSANMCRSVMAAAFLRRRLQPLGSCVQVESAGFLAVGYPPPAEVMLAIARYGLDVSSHRSRVVGEDDLATADLVAGMAREHVRLAVAAVPEAWPRCYTLKELVRRGEAGRPRAHGEPLSAWLSRIHEGRSRAAMLGGNSDDDVADPVEGPPPTYAETAAVLGGLVDRLAWLCWGASAQLAGQIPEGHGPAG